MALIKLLLEKYPEDDLSKKLKGDPVEDVYYLTSYKNLPYTIVYHQARMFFEDFEDEYPEKGKVVMDAVGVSTPNGVWYSSILDNLNSIPENIVQDMIDYVDKHLHLYEDKFPQSFTTSALMFREVIENEWLVHFSDNAYDIMQEGFTRGVADPTQLSLTVFMGEYEKEMGGFNFAYRQQDVHHAYVRGDRTKYGSEAVMFTVPKAIVCDHFGDEEPQTIFWGSMAENIVYVQYEAYEYQETELFIYLWDIMKPHVDELIEERHEPDDGDPEIERFIELLSEEDINGVEDLNKHFDVSDYDVQTETGWPLVDNFESVEAYGEEWDNILNVVTNYLDYEYDNKDIITCIQNVNGKEQIVYEEIIEDTPRYIDVLEHLNPNKFKK